MKSVPHVVARSKPGQCDPFFDNKALTDYECIAKAPAFQKQDVHRLCKASGDH
jgi:hypothetical protein